MFGVRMCFGRPCCARRACTRVASFNPSVLGDFDAAGEAGIVGDFDAADKACMRACARVASLLLGDFDAAGEACIVGDFDAADRACGQIGRASDALNFEIGRRPTLKVSK